MAENEPKKVDDQEELTLKEDKAATNGTIPPSQQTGTETQPKPASESAKNSK